MENMTVEKFGEENVRVIEDEIQVLGQMPNSIEYGWYLLCYIDD